MKLLFLSQLALLASTVAASPIELEARATTYCNRDNCFRGFLGKPAEATPFCMQYLGQLTTTTSVITETITTSTTTTTTIIEDTEIFYATTITITPAPAPPAKRTVNPASVSSFVKSCDYLTSRISSGCSCFLATDTTITVSAVSTQTLTEVVTFTQPHYAIFTITDTITRTPCTVGATPAFTNGGFDASPTDISPWYLDPDSWRWGVRAGGGRADIIADPDSPSPPNHLRAVSYLSTSQGGGGIVLMQRLNVCMDVDYYVYFSVKRATTLTYLTVYHHNQHKATIEIEPDWTEHRITINEDRYEEAFLRFIVRRESFVVGPVEDYVYIDSVRVEPVHPPVKRALPGLE